MFSPDPTKHPARVREKRKTRGAGLTAVRFWRLALGNLLHLVAAMFARDTSKRAGSEARGEGRDGGNLIETIPKPLVAQRAGGMYKVCIHAFFIRFSIPNQPIRRQPTNK